MEAYTVIASPEALAESSAALETKAAIIKTALDNIRDEVRKTASFWIGDSADLHRSNYEERIPEVDKMLGILNKEASTLKQISDNYAAAKGASLTLAESLPNNVIN